MKLRCRFFWHNWGLWGMPQKGYLRMVQHRFCKDCGRQQDRSFYAEQAMPSEQLYLDTVNNERGEE